VRPEVDPLRPQVAELAEELLPVRQRGVVGLVGAEEPPDLRHRSEVARRFDADRHGKRGVVATGRNGYSQGDQDQENAHEHRAAPET